MTPEQFAAKLAERLTPRYDLARPVYSLDLRSSDFAEFPELAGKRYVVRHRDHPGWPNRGTTLPAPAKGHDRTVTGKRLRAAAAEVVRTEYAPFLYRQARTADEVPDVPWDIAMRDACEHYLTDLKASHGADHNTFVNDRSAIRVHILPKWGDRVFTSIRRKELRHWIRNLQVEKSDGVGGRHRVLANRTTRKNILKTLRRIWAHCFEDEEPSFGRIRLERDLKLLRRRQALKAGDIETLTREMTTALTPAQVALALVAAMWFDLRSGTRTHGPKSVANTAAIIALLVATGARIEELLFLRWKMIHEEEGYIIMPGVKTEHSFRLVPLQDALRPWLRVLRRLAEETGGAHPERHVIFTHRRRIWRQAPHRTVQTHVTEALLRAGLKVPGKMLDGAATKWARHTHISWGISVPDLVDLNHLDQYTAHEPDIPPITQVYIDRWLKMLPASHRRYIEHLPTPEEVAAGVETFKPVGERR